MKQNNKNETQNGTNSIFGFGLIKRFQDSLERRRKKREVRQIKKKIFGMKSLESRFTEIFQINYWSDSQSVSGPGSTLSYTENLRKELPALFSKYKIESLFDAPCGDFGWMKYVMEKTSVRYDGGDIVAPLVAQLNDKHKSPQINFLHIDLTKDKFPKVDLMICRDCLFHLSFADTKLVFQNFVDANIKYLLTTTHIVGRDFKNKDIISGDFREIDLCAAPYNLPQDTLERITDWIPPFQPREMCLWSRDQVIAALKNFDLSKSQL